MTLWLFVLAQTAITVEGVYDVFLRIAVPLIVGVVAWVARTLLKLNDRTTVVESTMQTKDDATKDRALYFGALNELRKEIGQHLSDELRELKEEIKGMRSDMKGRRNP